MDTTDRMARGLCTLLAAFLLTTVAVVGAQQPAAGSPEQPPPAGTEIAIAEDDATPVFRRMCIKCHTPERVLAERRTRTQWEEVFEKMVRVGAFGTDDEWETVQTYLLRHYSKANVNRASAEDIALILGLSSEEAGAIVNYRKDKGPFVDFEALTKVPGVTFEKLAHSRTAITF